MQSTQNLILEYGRTRHGVGTLAHRLRKRLRSRAKHGDVLAQKFLGAYFKPTASIANIRAGLLNWFKKEGKIDG